MSRADRFEFTFDEETEKRLYDILTDMDTRNTNSFCIQDKRGYHAEYVKVIRCKDCKYYEPYDCGLHTGTWFPESYCDMAEREEELTEKEYEYVTLHHEDIHFIDEDAERAFYESLAERKEE